MMIEVILAIWLTLSLLIFPGFLLLSTLTDIKVVDRMLLAPGIGISLFVVISSSISSLWGYSFFSILWVYAVTGMILLGIYSITCKFKADSKTIIKIKLTKEVLFFIVFLILLVIFAIWTLTSIEIPADVDAQGFGYLALTVRMGGTLNNLGPFYPEVRWLYSPGFFILTAFLSDLFFLPINYAMMGLAYFLWLMVFPAALSVGRQFGDNRLGILICIFLIIGRGLFNALADSGYTKVLGALIIMVCVSSFFRVLNTDSIKIGNVFVAALSLSALCLSHPDSFIFFILAEIPFLLTIWLSRKTPNLQDYIVMFMIPGIAFILTLPWVVLQFPLFTSANIHSQLGSVPEIRWFRRMPFKNGTTIISFAVIGLFFSSFRRERRDVFLITWVLMIIDFAVFGVIDDFMSLFLPWRVTSYIYNPSLAWYGPIVPFAVLAAQFTHYLVKQKIFADPKVVIRKNLMKLSKRVSRKDLKTSFLLLLSLITGALFPIHIAPELANDAGNSGWLYLRFYLIWPRHGYATHSDIAAMTWIKNNTPEDALILNAPTFNGHWVPVISERKTIFFRNQPFFDKSGDQELSIMQTECKQAFYQPDCEESRAIINRYGITHIILPDRKLGRMFDNYYLVDHNAFSRTNYLTLVFEEGNAKVYRVTDSQF